MLAAMLVLALPSSSWSCVENFVPSGPVGLENQKIAESIARMLGGKLSGFDIMIRVERGVVTLTGHVANANDVLRATKIVRSHKLITTVRNMLKVRRRKRDRAFLTRIAW